MKKANDKHTSQDFDRKHGQDHVANNPRAAKDIPNKEDKRKEVRQEHTNHFTSREGYPEKK
jgi:hypothetical protein